MKKYEFKERTFSIILIIIKLQTKFAFNIDRLTPIIHCETVENWKFCLIPPLSPYWGNISFQSPMSGSIIFLSATI
jgi:hypothetical protein